MENKQEMSQQFMIGSWLVRPELDRIERNGQCIILEPRAMDILVYFSQHPGEVISADELIDNVWVDQIVCDNTVYQWIHKLRKVLGDDSHKPVYIDTITKKGYRLIAEVKFTDSLADSPTASRRRPLIAVVAVMLVVLVSIAVFRFFPAEQTTTTTDQVQEVLLEESHSIAVLPFLDLSPDADQEYFANGVTEEILHVISGIPELKVIGRSSSFRLL